MYPKSQNTLAKRQLPLSKKTPREIKEATQSSSLAAGGHNDTVQKGVWGILSLRFEGHPTTTPHRT